MNKNIPYIIIGALVVILILMLFTGKNKGKTITVKTDTITIVKTDTIREYHPKYKYKTIKDTIFKTDTLFNNGGYLLREIKTYNGTFYKAIVSGIQASLDTIEVYNKQIDRTITTTKTITEYKKTNDLFLYTGFDKVDKAFIPKIGLNLNIKSGIMFGGNIGIYNNKPIYGISIGYKLNK